MQKQIWLLKVLPIHANCRAKLYLSLKKVYKNPVTFAQHKKYKKGHKRLKIASKFEKSLRKTFASFDSSY